MVAFNVDVIFDYTNETQGTVENASCNNLENRIETEHVI